MSDIIEKNPQRQEMRLVYWKKIYIIENFLLK